MRHVPIAVIALGLAAGLARAEGPTLQSIEAEYKQAQAKFIEQRKAAGKTNQVIQAGESPGTRFAPRFLKFAETHPGDPEAIEALNLALRTSLGEKGTATWDGVVKLLRDRYVTDANVGRVFLWLSVRAHDAPSEAFLREVLARNPDRETRGHACQTLVRRVEREGGYGMRLREDPEARTEFEKRMGKARLDEELAKADRAAKAAAALADTFRQDYGDFFPTIQLGKPAPEVVSHGLGGETVRLSDLKGKVVVLDVWTTWCGPCKAMIPHEREMVARLKGKPFALVSISCDEHKKALTDFLAKEPMPWTHWWNGQDGGILTTWKISSYPTIYVLDAKGVIRHQDIRGEELEKAVDALLKESETKTSG
jgi:thiol-disulfide isomerase/thioredoxin